MSPIVGAELKHRAEQYATKKHALGTPEWAIAYNGYVHGYMIQEGEKIATVSVPVMSHVTNLDYLASLPLPPGFPKP